MLLLCNKKCRSPCLFKRKRAFISLLSLARGKFLSLCICMRSFARTNDTKIEHSRDVQCNTVYLTCHVFLNLRHNSF